MTTISEKIQQKEYRIEASRAQIARLQKDVAILEDAARILSEDEGDNRLAGQGEGKRSAA